MGELSRGLRPLLDRPPADPEPMAALERRVRHRRHRRRLAFAVASAAVVAVVVSASGVWPGQGDPGRLQTTAQVPAGPTKPVVVASGETQGHEWRLQAFEHDGDQCLDMLAGGRACFDLSTHRAVDLAVDFKVSEDATGTARTSVAALYGPVRRDVARIAIRLASGQVVELTPVGQDARFAVNFYVAVAPTDIPPFSELDQITVYDAAGNELDHLQPDCTPELAGGPGGGPAPLTIQIPALTPCI